MPEIGTFALTDYLPVEIVLEILDHIATEDDEDGPTKILEGQHLWKIATEITPLPGKQMSPMTEIAKIAFLRRNKISDHLLLDGLGSTPHYFSFISNLNIDKVLWVTYVPHYGAYRPVTNSWRATYPHWDHFESELALLIFACKRLHSLSLPGARCGYSACAQGAVTGQGLGVAIFNHSTLKTIEIRIPTSLWTSQRHYHLPMIEQDIRLNRSLFRELFEVGGIKVRFSYEGEEVLSVQKLQDQLHDRLEKRQQAQRE